MNDARTVRPGEAVRYRLPIRCTRRWHGEALQFFLLLLVGTPVFLLLEATGAPSWLRHIVAFLVGAAVGYFTRVEVVRDRRLP